MSRFRSRFMKLIKLMSAGDLRSVWNGLTLALYTAFDANLFKRFMRLMIRAPKRGLVKVANKPPKVSVIVPNFNHEPYLRKRLDSIYGQTYKNLEVILLDDCSTDESRKVLSDYQAKYPDITTTQFNGVNAGSLNRQWAKGIAASTGDLVWIAESDDYCDVDFLEKLVPAFSDESIMLAYCRTLFVDQNEEPFLSTEQYLSNLGGSRWAKEFVNSAADEANSYFSRKNLICNASSALFRNPRRLAFLKEESWLNLRICSDWIFYLNVMRGGSIYYTPATTNYYRRHTTNNSVSTYSKDFYYREHQIVGEVLAHLYNVDDDAIAGLHRKAKRDWLVNCPRRNISDFEGLFDSRKIEACRKDYKPNIAICSYGFTSGGGETLPIHLANSLKKLGHSVLFINFDLCQRNEGIRNLLSRDIPVLNLVSPNVFNKVAALRSAIRSFHIDIIHSHYRRVDQLIAENCSDLKVKHVVTLHGSYETLSEADQKRILSSLTQSVFAWVYIANKNLSSFTRFGHFDKSKFFQIHNAIEARPLRHRQRAELGIPEGAFVACLASRAIEEKGWREAVQAVSTARETSGRNIHLLLVGEGPVYDQLKNSVPSYVHCLGFQQDVPEYFEVSDVGLLPSYFPGESFPLVILDCLLAGRPVVASDIGEIRQMLTAPTGEMAGTVFELEQGRIPVQKLAGILAEYASNPSFHAAKLKIAEGVARKFDVNVMAKKYESIYLSAMTPPGLPGASNFLASPITDDNQHH